MSPLLRSRLNICGYKLPRDSFTNGDEVISRWRMSYIKVAYIYMHSLLVTIKTQWFGKYSKHFEA